MRTALAILRFAPGLLCGLLMFAWLLSQSTEFGARYWRSEIGFGYGCVAVANNYDAQPQYLSFFYQDLPLRPSLGRVAFIELPDKDFTAWPILLLVFWLFPVAVRCTQDKNLSRKFVWSYTAFLFLVTVAYIMVPVLALVKTV